LAMVSMLNCCPIMPEAPVHNDLIIPFSPSYSVRRTWPPVTLDRLH
jgi:hypothetical protein